jgi:hypothetical protein
MTSRFGDSRTGNEITMDLSHIINGDNLKYLETVEEILNGIYLHDGTKKYHMFVTDTHIYEVLETVFDYLMLDLDPYDIVQQQEQEQDQDDHDNYYERPTKLEIKTNRYQRNQMSKSKSTSTSTSTESDLRFYGNGAGDGYNYDFEY